MRFAISIPQYARDSRFDDDAFRAHLRRVEELGLFESALGAGAGDRRSRRPRAAPDADLRRGVHRAAAAWAARCSCCPLHNPLHLAKAISSLDCLSHGRVEVGVATGGRERPFAAFGVDPDRPVARFNEALALMKSVLDGA